MSVRRSSERLKELRVACEFIGRKWSYAIGGNNWGRENKNKLVEREALVDTVGIKSADLEEKLDVRKGRKLSLHLGCSESCKTLEQKFIFQIGTWFICVRRFA